jgi:hypothetical protein
MAYSGSPEGEQKKPRAEARGFFTEYEIREIFFLLREVALI